MRCSRSERIQTDPPLHETVLERGRGLMDRFTPGLFEAPLGQDSVGSRYGGLQAEIGTRHGQD